MGDLVKKKRDINIERKDNKTIINIDSDIIIKINGKLSIQLEGPLNLLSSNEINVDAIKDYETNNPITLNSRMNESIKYLPSSIEYRKKQRIKQEESLKQINTLLLKDGIDILKIINQIGDD